MKSNKTKLVVVVGIFSAIAFVLQVIGSMMGIKVSGFLEIEISDYGTGIEDIDKAMQPLYTSRPDGDRSGMGFTVMQTFMDELEVLVREKMQNGALEEDAALGEDEDFEIKDFDEEEI